MLALRQSLSDELHWILCLPGLYVDQAAWSLEQASLGKNAADLCLRIGVTKPHRIAHADCGCPKHLHQWTHSCVLNLTHVSRYHLFGYKAF